MIQWIDNNMGNREEEGIQRHTRPDLAAAATDDACISPYLNKVLCKWRCKQDLFLIHLPLLIPLLKYFRVLSCPSCARYSCSRANIIRLFLRFIAFYSSIPQ